MCAFCFYVHLVVNMEDACYDGTTVSGSRRNRPHAARDDSRRPARGSRGDTAVNGANVRLEPST